MLTLASSAVTAIASSNVAAVILVEMWFSSGTIRLCTAAVDVVYSGNTYLASGPLGTVEAIKDSTGTPSSLSLSISGVPTENLSLALNTSARNVACYLRLAIMDGTTQAILDAPLLGAFRLDQMTINGSTIAVTAHPLHRTFSRAKPVRYTDVDQQRLYAGDKSLQYITSQAQKTDVWPAASWGRK